jgi:tRNA dimethylallyltransferase
MSKSLSPLIVIAGPTASGKSALALALAEREDGVVINADSAQIYRDLPILSAAPTQEDKSRAEHRLYGVRDGALPCSAADWAGLAKGEVRRAHGLGKLPILVGGTGLYLRTLLDGIAPVPSIDPQIRRRVRSSSIADNRAELERLDPAATARLNPADTTRIARALEVALSTGRTLKVWQADRHGGIGGEVALRPLILLPPREWLFGRCDARFAGMIEAGAIAEVERLLALNLDPALPVMRTIGVREISALLRGETSRESMVATGQQATRRYAKRQYTWFAHQPPADWPRHFTPISVRADGENQHHLGDGAFSSIVEALSFLQSN